MSSWRCNPAMGLRMDRLSIFSCLQTRVLVTHGVNFLPYVDEIVVLVDGKVSEVGSYKSLLSSKGAFSEFLETYAKEQSNRTNSEAGKCTPPFALPDYCAFVAQLKLILHINLVYETCNHCFFFFFFFFFLFFFFFF